MHVDINRLWPDMFLVVLHPTQGSNNKKGSEVQMFAILSINSLFKYRGQRRF